ncbi:hypothetical protein B566_EDAN017517 [Ephemera danica]|nr:hypothetical protein B566_EDAN017517 [Ephemera danica]
MGLIVPSLQIPAIHQKRTLAFINNFITSTVAMMNKLARSCEMKLQKFECKLQRMDACLKILEAKLDSIPGLEGATEQEIQPLSQETTVPIEKTSSDNTKAPEVPHQEKTVEPSAPVASQDPQYSKYFRMVQVGVPVQAVKLKMQQEGLDPSVLDNPGSAPPLPTPKAGSDSDSRSSSISD